ncbi:hypothetical protein HD806DRAFT_111129 [Xylariaceae sp. AK1471]|nr:hypothetical protein HD806DRAFT_111129 [Xylariaceae sp. AK1471]
MLSQIVAISGLLTATWFAPLVGARGATTVRLSPRVDDYVWTVTWTGPKTCPSWPCTYSYEVSAPSYSSAQGSIPLFDASCQGTVDKPLTTCSLLSGAPLAVSGNFSTFETSGVGNGLIDITATWADQASGVNTILTAVTPMQANNTNHGTWSVQPDGCPVTACATTRMRQRRSVV